MAPEPGLHCSYRKLSFFIHHHSSHSLLLFLTMPKPKVYQKSFWQLLTYLHFEGLDHLLRSSAFPCFWPLALSLSSNLDLAKHSSYCLSICLKDFAHWVSYTKYDSFIVRFTSGLAIHRKYLLSGCRSQPFRESARLQSNVLDNAVEE